MWRGQLAAPVNFGITEWVLCDPRSDPACSALVIASRGSSRGYSQEGKAKGQGAGGGGKRSIHGRMDSKEAIVCARVR